MTTRLEPTQTDYEREKMRQPSSKPSKHAANKHQTSISFSPEMIAYLDDMTEKVGINRTALVCLIIQNFIDSGKVVKFVIEDSVLSPVLDAVLEDFKVIQKGSEMVVTISPRNEKIMEMHTAGYSTREIATAMDLSYQTVYGVIRKSKS